ncbi:MAG: MerR family transcriptional regulator [Ilyomonas sp.]
MSQLSLFGLAQETTPAEKKQVEEKVITQNELPVIDEEVVVSKDAMKEMFQEENSDAKDISEFVRKETNANGTLLKEGAIVFANANIAVKVKKTEPVIKEEVKEEEKAGERNDVLQVETASAKDFLSATTEVRILKKRGRKSFKEIDAEVDLIEVPDDEILFQKQYYPMRVVAKWFRVNSSLLRYWENEFDVLKPRKNRKGDRLFRPEDVKSLQVIYYLLRQRKFTIEGAKKYLKANRKSADANLQLIQSLTKFRGFLLELKANLEA